VEVRSRTMTGFRVLGWCDGTTEAHVIKRHAWQTAGPLQSLAALVDDTDPAARYTNCRKKASLEYFVNFSETAWNSNTKLTHLFAVSLYVHKPNEF